MNEIATNANISIVCSEKKNFFLPPLLIIYGLFKNKDNK